MVYSKKGGGNAYNNLMANILSQYFDFDVVEAGSDYFNPLLRGAKWMINLKKISGESDIWIRDFYSTITLPLDKTKGKNIALMHQVDFSVHKMPLRLIFFLMEKVFCKNAKKLDAIIVVSDFWKNYFLRKGFRNVYKIYNSFSVSDFRFSNKEIYQFKKKHNLLDKPIVYIGNCQKMKGVVESWRVLKDLDVYLITSGEKRIEIPSLNLNLSQRDYFRLLKSSSVVVTMSQFKEGWCRTSHEAMLCKTPVIGSGEGGMEELLTKGGQVICKDFNLLKNEVEDILNNPEKKNKIAERGYNFAKNFDLNYFEKEWIKLIKSI